ncbi:hypothetical protein UNDKW_0781 [Undibacterium sp. KW1]|nr:hypothetical protein UNDKW_0781 [Undibacterium sp. KW1]
MMQRMPPFEWLQAVEYEPVQEVFYKSGCKQADKHKYDYLSQLAQRSAQGQKNQ